MRIKLHYLIFTLLLLSSGSLWAQGNQTKTSIRAVRDITYKVTGGQDSIKLDLFLPAEKKFLKTPLILLIHGGAWIKGDKNFEKQYFTRNLRDRLQAAGYAFISINYRLLNAQTHLRDQLADVYDAVEWIKENADQYDLDLNNVGLIGESAGAHLALLLAYSDLQKSDIGFKYILDVFGPTNLNKLLRTNASWFTKTMFRWIQPKLYHLRNELLYFMTAKDIEQNKSQVIEIASRYSPIEQMDDSDKIPALILHGNKDKVVAFRQSIKLKKKMDHLGIENRLIKVDKGNHGFTSTSHERLDELVQASLLFAENHTYDNEKRGM